MGFILSQRSYKSPHGIKYKLIDVIDGDMK